MHIARLLIRSPKYTGTLILKCLCLISSAARSKKEGKYGKKIPIILSREFFFLHNEGLLIINKPEIHQDSYFENIYAVLLPVASKR